MGNCVFKGFGEISELEVVKVVTSSGGIMELYAPITVNSITNEFPGHAIFRRRDLFSQPLLHSDELHPGELYYLLPLNPYKTTTTTVANGGNDVVVTPYRMSCEGHNAAKGRRPDHHHHEVFPRYNSGGVWKVKLVISPEQLSEILSQEARTEALIESVRTVAKCGSCSGGGGGASSVASSDHWSVSSSWKGL